jgi:hypothetical protein
MPPRCTILGKNATSHQWSEMLGSKPKAEVYGKCQ